MIGARVQVTTEHIVGPWNWFPVMGTVVEFKPRDADFPEDLYVVELDEPREGQKKFSLFKQDIRFV